MRSNSFISIYVHSTGTLHIKRLLDQGTISDGPEKLQFYTCLEVESVGHNEADFKSAVYPGWIYFPKCLIEGYNDKKFQYNGRATVSFLN